MIPRTASLTSMCATAAPRQRGLCVKGGHVLLVEELRDAVLSQSLDRKPVDPTHDAGAFLVDYEMSGVALPAHSLSTAEENQATWRRDSGPVQRRFSV
jgi:hypothetical protein